MMQVVPLTPGCRLLVALHQLAAWLADSANLEYLRILLWWHEPPSYEPWVEALRSFRIFCRRHSLSAVTPWNVFRMLPAHSLTLKTQSKKTLSLSLSLCFAVLWRHSSSFQIIMTTYWVLSLLLGHHHRVQHAYTQLYYKLQVSIWFSFYCKVDSNYITT